LGTIRKETGSGKWALFSALYSFALAWLLAAAVYQAGSLLGFA
jgi:ferrous iron transport protein B